MSNLVADALEQLDETLDTVEMLLREIPMDRKEERRLIGMLYEIYSMAEEGAEASYEAQKA